jgi:transposase
MKQTTPRIIELDAHKLEKLLGRAEAALNEEDYETIKAVVESYAYIANLVGDKNTTVARLRKLLFGAKTEKTAAVIGDAKDSQLPPAQDAAAGPVTSPAGNAAVLRGGGPFS